MSIANVLKISVYCQQAVGQYPSSIMVELVLGTVYIESYSPGKLPDIY